MNLEDSSEVAMQIAKSENRDEVKVALLALFKLEKKKLNLDSWHYTAEYEKALQKAIKELPTR